MRGAAVRNKDQFSRLFEIFNYGQLGTKRFPVFPRSFRKTLSEQNIRSLMRRRNRLPVTRVSQMSHDESNVAIQKQQSRAAYACAGEAGQKSMTGFNFTQYHKSNYHSGETLII